MFTYGIPNQKQATMKNNKKPTQKNTSPVCYEGYEAIREELRPEFRKSKETSRTGKQEQKD